MGKFMEVRVLVLLNFLSDRISFNAHAKLLERMGVLEVIDALEKRKGGAGLVAPSNEVVVI